MIEITSHRQGSILNHNHGRESEDSLVILLEGFGSGTPVKVNGEKAEMYGRRFVKELTLTQKINVVTVSEQTPFGKYSQEIVIVWDKKSFKRFNFYIDDHSFLFADLTKERPKSAFDHFYLKRLKEIRNKYPFKVTLNCFYYNDHDKSFSLDQMPDLWKQEFKDNSDWLKFSFHARSEFPDRIYLESSPEEFGKDWDMVQNEIIRFAGEESYIPPDIVHWGNIHPTVAREYVRRGSKSNKTSMRPMVMGGPSLAERMKGGNMDNTPSRDVFKDRDDLEGFALFYDRHEERSFLSKYGNYYDPLMDLVIRGDGAICCNLVPLEKTEDKVKASLKRLASGGGEFINAATHEQYSFPYYCNYQPDHLDRIELTVKTLTEAGYSPIFFNQGFMGNTAWEK